jgi:hypothetical protein
MRRILILAAIAAVAAGLTPLFGRGPTSSELSPQVLPVQ